MSIIHHFNWHDTANSTLSRVAASSRALALPLAIAAAANIAVGAGDGARIAKSACSDNVTPKIVDFVQNPVLPIPQAPVGTSRITGDLGSNAGALVLTLVGVKIAASTLWLGDRAGGAIGERIKQRYCAGPGL